MSRREFSAKTKAKAFLRAAGTCEAKDCGSRLTIGKFHYDHIIADGLNGDNSLDNCAVLCVGCHSKKTPFDVKYIAKAKRIEAKHRGIKKPSKFACSRSSKWKKTFYHGVILRDGK